MTAENRVAALPPSSNASIMAIAIPNTIRSPATPTTITQLGSQPSGKMSNAVPSAKKSVAANNKAFGRDGRSSPQLSARMAQNNKTTVPNKSTKITAAKTPYQAPACGVPSGEMVIINSVAAIKV